MSLTGTVVEDAVSLSVKSIAGKLGASLLTTLMKSPISFFAKWGLSELFGTGSGDEFKQVFAKLDELEKDIENAVGQIKEVVQASQLEEEHTRIKALFLDLKSAATDKSDVTTGFKAAFDSFYADDIVNIINNISACTESIKDRLLAQGAEKGSGNYITIVSDNMYDKNTDIEYFYKRLDGIGKLYITDMIHASLVLTCIVKFAQDHEHVILADSQVQRINGFSDQICDMVNQKLRDIPDVVSGFKNRQFRILNHATQKVLARYAEVEMFEFGTDVNFSLIKKDAGYYYLKLSDKDIGVDHYYGRDIRSVQKADSNHPNHLWRFDSSTEEPSRWFHIVNRATGRALDHYYGRDIRTADVDGNHYHLWEVIPAKDGQSVNIINVATGCLLGCSNSKTISGIKGKVTIDVGTFSENSKIPFGHESSAWNLSPEGDAPYLNLVNIQGGECIDHYDGHSFRFVHAPSGHPNHCWKIEPTVFDNDHAVVFIRNKATNQVLDHYYGETLRGANDTNAKAPNMNHVWKITKIDS